ncbi:MAG: hypothetical protein ACU84Q_19400 [Gammaproteobacteria bacterium]
MEENGIATVIVGSAKDILQYCGAPRFVFTDFPLGNPCGKPFDQESQSIVFSAALKLLVEADKPGAFVKSELAWGSDFDWKRNYMYVGPENAEELKAKGEQRRIAQQQLRARLLANRNSA